MPVILFSISGNAGIAAATVTLSGYASASTTAASDGTYSFGGLLNGNYVVTPSLAGYTFSPTSQSVSIAGASVTGVNFVATIVGPSGKTTIPLPFSQRETAAVAAFACLQIASPEGILRTLISDGPTIIALQLEYAQLLNVYLALRQQTSADRRTELIAAVTQAVTSVGNLNTTVQAMTAVGDAAVVLAGLQSVVAGALKQVQDVQFDEQ